jgi:hypothetical protein
MRWFSPVAEIFRSLGRRRRGGVSTIVALTLPLLIAIVGLAAEYGHGLLVKVENQRAADLAAYAGALAYNASGSTAAMTTAATASAALNGLAASTVSASLVTSPSGDGGQAVMVTIATQVPLMLSPILGSGAVLPVSSTAYAELKGGTPACILALDQSGAGLALSGGAAVTAKACAVASNNTVSVPCGTTLTTIALDYGSTSAPSQPCNGITPPAGVASVTIAHAITTDPLAGFAGITQANDHLATVTAMAAPIAPSVPAGGDIAFGWSVASTQAQATADGCTASFSASTWTLTCPGARTYKFGSITVGGGITVNFNTAGSAATVYDFSGSIASTGAAMSFGPGVYNIARGISTGGGTVTSFGAGTFTIGAGSGVCSGGGRYSICNKGTSLTFGGPSTFVLTAGVYNDGGARLTLGSGATNSFQIGPSSNGNALYASGGSTTVFGDATGPASLFQLVGDLDISSGGGSCTTLGAAAQHDISGDFATAGGTLLGSGVYTVGGYVGLGANGGGDVSCGGSLVGLSGAGVTFVVGGASTPNSGGCAGQSFCIAAGYQSVTLTAPTSGPTANIVVIGPISASNSAGATLVEGASNTSLSGAFYFPNGPISLSGGASVGGGASQCLELIGSQVTLKGGTTAVSQCVSGTASGASVRLVQ